MTPDRVLAQYERIVDAPDAIERLRRFIRDLAVRGKLVPQHSKDEPASELLKRIAAEKGRLGLKRGVSTRTDEALFALPLGWSWTSIGEVCSKTGSGSTPRGGRSVYKNQGIPFIRSQNVYDDGLRLDEVAYIDGAIHRRMAGTAVKARDLLLNITGGSIGRCCLIRDDFEEGNVSQHVAIIRAVLPELASFLHQLILSPYFQNYIFEKQTGAGRGGLPKNKMDRIAVALPPLAEQQRIVAKTDELMTLCNRLEAARVDRESARDRLANASLARVNTPDPDTFQDDALFTLDVLPALTTRSDQIKQLRESILNLAVRGRLVPQDPKDEPASELVDRIRLGTSKVIKRTKRATRIGPSDCPFQCPTGWSWVSVQSLLDPAREVSYGIIKLGEEPRTGGVRTLRCSDIKPGYIDTSAVRRVSEEIEAEYVRTRLAGGEIVINIRGTLGGVALVSKSLSGLNVAREVAVVPVSRELVSNFLVYVMLSGYFWEATLKSLRGIAYKGLNLGALRLFPVPLPPLAEQHRIVAKVDELMTLCDHLEASLMTGEYTRRRLLDALLVEALMVGEPRKLEAVA